MTLNAISFLVVTGLSSFFNPSNMTHNPGREDVGTRWVLKRVKARLREISDTIVLNQRLSLASDLQLLRLSFLHTSPRFIEIYWHAALSIERDQGGRVEGHENYFLQWAYLKDI